MNEPLNERAFEHFVALITFDRNLAALRATVAQHEKKLASLDADLAAQKKDLDRAHQHVLAMRKEVDTQELAMRELDAAEKLAKKRLESVTQQKEYQAIKHEIDQLRTQQHDFEDALIAVWARLETAQEDEVQQQKIYQERSAALHHERTLCEQARDAAEQEYAAQIGQRAPLEELVPTNWRDQYERMKESLADPVAGVQGGSCDACHYEISKQDLMRLQHHALLNCKGCYRLLYMQTQPPLADK